MRRDASATSAATWTLSVVPFSLPEASLAWPAALTLDSIIRVDSSRPLPKMKRSVRNHRDGPSIFASLGQAFNFHHRHEQQRQQERLQDHKFQRLVRDRITALHALLLSMGSLNLAWLLLALDTVTLLIREAQAMVPSDLPESDEKWMGEYLDDTVKLLDALNELRQIVSGTEHRNMSLKLASSILLAKECDQQMDKARKCIDEYNEAEGKYRAHISSCLAALEGMVPPPPKQKHHRHKEQFLMVVYTTKVVSAFILGTVVSALGSETVSKPVSWTTPTGFPWSKPLLGLLQSIKQLEPPVLDESRLLRTELIRTIRLLEEAEGCKQPKVDILRTASEEVAPQEGKQVPPIDPEGGCCKRRAAGDGESDSCKRRAVETEAPSKEVQAQCLKAVVAKMEAGLQLVRQQADALFHIVVSNRNMLLHGPNVKCV